MPKKAKTNRSGNYDRIWADDWKDMTSFGPSYRTRYRLIQKYMRRYSATQGSLLDAGCGDGTLLLNLKKRFPSLKLYGFDVSSYVIKKSSIRLTVGDLTKKKTLPKKRFDIIVCSEVLEHIKDYKIAIANLCRLLRKGGKIFITSPYGMKNWTPHDDYAHHIRRWEPDMIEKELQAHGVRVLESRVWGGFVYDKYYKYWLARQDPRKIATANKGLLKRIVARTLYTLFRFDDFISSKGRTLIVVGEKR